MNKTSRPDGFYWAKETKESNWEVIGIWKGVVSQLGTDVPASEKDFFVIGSKLEKSTNEKE
jgi:hypothetical protein